MAQGHAGLTRSVWWTKLYNHGLNGYMVGVKGDIMSKHGYLVSRETHGHTGSNSIMGTWLVSIETQGNTGPNGIFGIRLVSIETQGHTRPNTMMGTWLVSRS